MEIIEGKESDHLAEHILQKGESLLFAGAVDLLEDAPLGLDGEGAASAGELRIGREGSHAVARHFDLGDDIDKAVSGVGDHFLDLLLGVESSVAAAIGLGAPGADFGQARVFFDLDAPALVFSEVPVQAVHLVERHPVDDPLHIGHAVKVAPDVDVDPAPAEMGLVNDLEGGQNDAPFSAAGGKHLPQGLTAAVETRRSLRGEKNLAPRNGQPVALGACVHQARVEKETDLGAPSRITGGENRQVKAAALPDLGAEEAGDAAGLGALRGIEDPGGSRKGKVPLARGHLHRLRDQGHAGSSRRGQSQKK